MPHNLSHLPEELQNVVNTHHDRTTAYNMLLVSRAFSQDISLKSQLLLQKFPYLKRLKPECFGKSSVFIGSVAELNQLGQKEAAKWDSLKEEWKETRAEFINYVEGRRDWARNTVPLQLVASEIPSGLRKYLKCEVNGARLPTQLEIHLDGQSLFKVHVPNREALNPALSAVARYVDGGLKEKINLEFARPLFETPTRGSGIGYRYLAEENILRCSVELCREDWASNDEYNSIFSGAQQLDDVRLGVMKEQHHLPHRAHFLVIALAFGYDEVLADLQALQDDQANVGPIGPGSGVYEACKKAIQLDNVRIFEKLFREIQLRLSELAKTEIQALALSSQSPEIREMFLSIMDEGSIAARVKRTRLK